MPVDFGSDSMVEWHSGITEQGLFPPERRLVEDHFSKPGAKVLDLGCGTGRTTAPLARAGFDVVGVDVSQEMIERARRLFPDLTFRLGDATDLEFDDGTFEYVLFSFNGLDYVETEAKRLEALREVRRVLRDGGKFAFSTHNSWFVLPQSLSNVFQYVEIVKFWATNLRRGRVFSNYKIDTTVGDGVETYFINPRDQRRQLEECGFRLLDLYGKPDGPITRLDPWPYYVAQKRPT